MRSDEDGAVHHESALTVVGVEVVIPHGVRDLGRRHSLGRQAIHCVLVAQEERQNRGDDNYQCQPKANCEPPLHSWDRLLGSDRAYATP